MKGYYNKNSKLDFGMYKGYDLGVVYVFDPSYIDWCINNIDKFHITDLNELKEYGVINEKLDWQYKMIGDPSLIPNIDIFGTFQELIENVNLGDKKYQFSDETLKKNEGKFNYKNQIYMESENNYDDYNDYDDYDGYDEQDNWDSDGGCGEGHSCDECDNVGCNAHPLN